MRTSTPSSRRARIQEAHYVAARHRLARTRRRSADVPPAQNRLIGRSARDRVPAPVAARPSWTPLASWAALDATTSN